MPTHRYLDKSSNFKPLARQKRTHADANGPGYRICEMGVNFRCFHKTVSLKPRSAGTTVSLEVPQFAHGSGRTLLQPAAPRAALIGAPDHLRRRRHGDVADAEVGERIDQRIGDRRQRADACRLRRRP